LRDKPCDTAHRLPQPNQAWLHRQRQQLLLLLMVVYLKLLKNFLRHRAAPVEHTSKPIMDRKHSAQREKRARDKPAAARTRSSSKKAKCASATEAEPDQREFAAIEEFFTKGAVLWQLYKYPKHQTPSDAIKLVSLGDNQVTLRRTLVTDNRSALAQERADVIHTEITARQAEVGKLGGQADAILTALKSDTAPASWHEDFKFLFLAKEKHEAEIARLESVLRATVQVAVTTKTLDYQITLKNTTTSTRTEPMEVDVPRHDARGKEAALDPMDGCAICTRELAEACLFHETRECSAASSAASTTSIASCSASTPAAATTSATSSASSTSSGSNKIKCGTLANSRCNHRFHADCIHGWLTKGHGTCPLCDLPWVHVTHVVLK
jgi:hypothetical protein